MRLAALEESLEKLSLVELTELISALDVCCKKLPEQLIQEMGLRTLWKFSQIVLEKGEAKNE